MTSTPRPDIPRWQRGALILCMFLITSTFGFVQPFVPLYLEASGLTRGQIGLVTGLGTGLALLVQPMLGRLSDRLDARRPLMAVAALLAGVAYLSYRNAHSAPAFLLLGALGVNGALYLNAAGGALVGRLVAGTQGGGAAYAGYRVWGSVGYILVTLLAGWLLNPMGGSARLMSREALAPVFLYGPALFFAVAVVACFVPDRPSAPALTTTALPHPTEMRGLPPDNLRWFLIAFFLYIFGLYGASAYLSLYMKALGATPLWITGVFAAGVVCEVLVMRRVGRLTDRYGRRPALALTFLLMPIRLLLYIPATGPLWVLLVQMLHGINFGIMGTIAVVFVNDQATNQDRGRAQARLVGVQGLASATGPICCGWLAQQFGMGWMFFAMALVGVAAASIFLARVHDSHPNPVSLTQRLPAFLHPLLRRLETPFRG